jgi:monoamine oxidase
LRFRRPFWEEARLRGISFLHAPRELVPTWWSLRHLETPVLVGWAGAGTATALTALGHARMLEAVVTSLARGAYAHPRIGGENAARLLARPIERTIFFAGEGTCPGADSGTVHGAWESGRRAARQVLSV